ncbi:ABC transporter substrate-binding protein [Paracoccaceae bacterium GXU_MW_L88]
MIRTTLAALLASAALAHAQPIDWEATVAAAEGQTVQFHAWAGSEGINAYIDWVAEQVAPMGVTLEHVKISDTADTVSRVLAEKTAGQDENGAVDLIWINGANFAAMKENGLLFGPWAEDLPHFDLVDVEGKPTTVNDFGVDVEGYEAPWDMAQLVFEHDSESLPEPPMSIAALADWAAGNPGRFTYPQPPDYLGETFLKQVLLSLTDSPEMFLEPATDETYEAATAPLWDYLDALHPNLWRSARAFPENETALRQLLADGEIEIGFAYNPGGASAAIAEGILPETVRTFVMEGGTLANTNFVAIPYNSPDKEAAMVVANFLLSPEAQARKQEGDLWGGNTVLDVAALPDDQRALFDVERGPATLSPEDLGASLPEPHVSWSERISEEWQRRYGQ